MNTRFLSDQTPRKRAPQNLGPHRPPRLGPPTPLQTGSTISVACMGKVTPLVVPPLDVHLPSCVLLALWRSLAGRRPGEDGPHARTTAVQRGRRALRRWRGLPVSDGVLAQGCSCQHGCPNHAHLNQ